VPIPPPPVEVADATALDETIARTAEVAYKATRLAAELLVDVGALKGDAARVAAELDRKAFTAVEAVRAAYRAGNAEGYIAAGREAEKAVAAFLDVVKGG